MGEEPGIALLFLTQSVPGLLGLPTPALDRHDTAAIWDLRLHGEPRGPPSIPGTARFVLTTFYIALTLVSGRTTPASADQGQGLIGSPAAVVLRLGLISPRPQNRTCGVPSPFGLANGGGGRVTPGTSSVSRGWQSHSLPETTRREAWTSLLDLRNRRIGPQPGAENVGESCSGSAMSNVSIHVGPLAAPLRAFEGTEHQVDGCG